jgi:hypothetical protein
MQRFRSRGERAAGGDGCGDRVGAALSAVAILPARSAAALGDAAPFRASMSSIVALWTEPASGGAAARKLLFGESPSS